MTGPTDPWQQPAQGEPPPYYAPPYAPPPYAPPPYAAPGGWAPWATAGPPGQVRPTGRCVLLFLVTFGIYAYVWNYQVHAEMKAHSGRGIGGGIALLLTFIAGAAMPFVTSAEVGGLYSRRGEPEPVRGWTGLWLLVPVAGGYVALMAGLVALSASSPTGEPGDAGMLTFVVLMVLWLVAAIAGAVIWFTRTNGALNRYWESLATR